MSKDQLEGRLTHLQHELANAFGTVPWPQALIERLADDLCALEGLLHSSNGR